MSLSTILSLDPAFLSMMGSALTFADIAAIEAISLDVHAAVHLSATWLHLATGYPPRFNFGHELFLPAFVLREDVVHFRQLVGAIGLGVEAHQLFTRLWRIACMVRLTD